MGVAPLDAVFFVCVGVAKCVSFHPFRVLKEPTQIYDCPSGWRDGSEADGDESYNSKPQDLIWGNMGTSWDGSYKGNCPNMLPRL